MKKIELKVTLYFKEEKDLNSHQIMDVCENVSNALSHSDNVTNDITSLSVLNREDGRTILYGKKITQTK